MADNMEVIVSAIDEASEIFSSIVASCEEMMSGISASADEASVSIPLVVFFFSFSLAFGHGNWKGHYHLPGF